MPTWLKHLPAAGRYCADSLLTAGCWILWFTLAALLVAQAGIAVNHELAVPAFVLRTLESRFAASHVEARFGRAVFDPTGRLLLENLQLSLPGFEEPVARARAVFVELDPWLLLAGRFEARRVRATGVDLFVPAMLAPSGKTEKSLGDLDLDLTPGDGQLVIHQLCATVAGVELDARGALQLPQLPRTAGVRPLPLLETLSSHFPDFNRRIIRASAALAAFDQPQLHVTLSPSPTRGAIALLTLTARGARWTQFHGLAVSGLRASARLPLLGDTPTMSSLRLQCEELHLDGGVTVRDGRAWIRGALNPAKFSFVPQKARLALRTVSRGAFTFDAVSAEVTPGPLPLLAADLVASCAGSPLALQGRGDLAHQTAAIHLAGALAPAVRDTVAALLHRDLRPFVGFGAPVAFDLTADFAPGWKFQRVTGRIAARHVDARGVPLDRIGGEVEFDGTRFVARHAIAQLGDDVARGTFEQNVATQEYRFLLAGRLRPLDIRDWFHEWWEHVFGNFAFPAAPPEASVDVQGRWHAPHESDVFVYADARSAAVRGVPFDRLRTLLFLRPNFIDGLEIFGTRGTSEVRGTFVRHVDLAVNEWRDMTIDLTSTFPLADAARLLGPAIAARLDPFVCENPPRVKISGHFDGPATPGEAHQSLAIAAQTTGAFSIYQFPVRDLSFTAALQDHDLTLDHVDATFANGHLAGHARLWGRSPDRRLAFDATLSGASLAQAVTTVSNYKAQHRGRPPRAASTFFSGQTSARLDLSLAAEGNFTNLLSYRGKGSASLSGELGEVRLLGLLSALLNFTALRFTAAHGDFSLEGAQLVFPSVSVTGRNSAIQARGTYALDRDALAFNARVYPFQESKSLLQSVVGAVLTPLSTVLEVKLTGPLSEPNWAFVIGPTNLLRSLASPAPNNPQPAPGSPPSETPPDYLKRQ